MQINVKKRNGEMEPFQLDKIRQCIEFACSGLDVNPLALESLFSENIFDGITTKAIHDNLIHHAKTLCDISEPDWTIVAGRLETMNLWAETGSYRISFTEFVNEQIRLGVWQHEGLKSYSEKDLEELEAYLNQEADLNHSYSSIITAQQKYLASGECVQHMFMGNAMVIASIEPEENRLAFCKEVYEAFSDRMLSSATPWLSNLRGNGNISSCFILAVADDIDSIFDNIKNAALISKNGGGIGVYIGKLRAMGSSLMGQDGKSGGVMGWVKLFNDVAVAVNQCFDGDTLVITNRGEIKIKDVKIGDMVLTHDGSFQEIEEVYTAESEELEMYEIETEDGVVTVSHNHPVLVIRNNVRQWKDAGELVEGDEIICV